MLKTDFKNWFILDCKSQEIIKLDNIEIKKFILNNTCKYVDRQIYIKNKGLLYIDFLINSDKLN